MGKTQSKRSVDITTEGKKTGEEEVTGKLEKIEDVDQSKQSIGDASDECNQPEKKLDVDESENDKDLTTEKNAELLQNAETGETNQVLDAATLNLAEGNLNAVEEISPLSDESIKKSKKEKVKKKWSFRSISFGKKDKQKPNKIEDTTENILANGEAEKSTADDGCDSHKEMETAGDVELKPKTNTPTFENKKKTPTEEIAKINDDIRALASEDASEPPTTLIEKKTDGNTCITVKNVEDIHTNIINSEANTTEKKLSGMATLTLDNKTPSQCTNEATTNKSIMVDNDECDEEKNQENGTTEKQTNLHFEVNNGKASEELLTSDPIITNVNEEKCVDDDKEFNEILNMSNSCGESLKCSILNGSHPPPLPCSPPPSQVSVFAFGNNAESETSTIKDILKTMDTEQQENGISNDCTKVSSVPIQYGCNIDKVSVETKKSLILSSLHESDNEELKSAHIKVSDNNEQIQNDRIEKTSNAQLENKELLAASTIVNEITEHAVVIQQQLHRDEDNSVEINGEENNAIGEGCFVSSPLSSHFTISSELNDKFEKPDTEIQNNTEKLLKIEDCSLNETDIITLNEDELTNNFKIAKDLTKENNVPDTTTQEVTVASE